ncbi:Protein WVD2-like 4 [Linum grandiflorum]
MGETATCLILHHHQQPFSYAAGISNDPNQLQGSNLISSLAGQSVSFGRFTSESLSWEKWSSFSSHNKYVEEAEKFSRPGSVAEKKAFFEAHYRNLAARKAAEAAKAAEEAAAAAAVAVAETNCVQSVPSKELDESNPPPEKQDVEFGCVKLEALRREVEAVIGRIDEGGKENVENSVHHKQMEKPLLKQDFMANANDSDSPMMMKKKPSVSFSRTLVFGKAASASSASKVAAFSSPAAKRPVGGVSTTTTPMSKRSTPKSTHSNKGAMNFTPVREINRLTSTIIRKIDGCSRASKTAIKDWSSITPLRTPTVATRTDESRHPQMTPQSETWRARTPLHPSAATTESKPVRPRWHFLPTDCSKFMSGSRNKFNDSPSFTTPFRTEERAARRKKKLEEKFNANQVQKVQLQATIKEKAETEIKKLRQSLCFKARPLPGFYKQRVTPKNQIHKVPSSEPEIQDHPTPGVHIERSASKNSGRTVKKNENNNNNNPRSLRARLNATATENATSRQQTSKPAS